MFYQTGGVGRGNQVRQFFVYREHIFDPKYQIPLSQKHQLRELFLMMMQKSFFQDIVAAGSLRCWQSLGERWAIAIL